LDNKKINRVSAISAIIFNSALLLGALYFFHDIANAQENEITFYLQGAHQKDTVSQTAEALGWNVTVFERLINETIVVTAIPINNNNNNNNNNNTSR
jgi:hypothetical protein